MFSAWAMKAQLQQRVDAVTADGERHGAERAKRGEAHDDSDHPEQRAAGLIQEDRDRLAGLAHAGQTQPE